MNTFAIESVKSICGDPWFLFCRANYILNHKVGEKCPFPKLKSFTSSFPPSEHFRNNPQDYGVWDDLGEDVHLHFEYIYWCMENGKLDQLRFACEVFYHGGGDVPSTTLVAKALTLQSSPHFFKVLIFSIETVLFWSKLDKDYPVEFFGIEDPKIRSVLNNLLPYFGDDGLERIYICDPNGYSFEEKKYLETLVKNIKMNLNSY